MKKLLAIAAIFAAITSAYAGFSDDVNKAAQAVIANTKIPADAKGEVAFAAAMKIPLDDSIIGITRVAGESGDYQYFRLHSVARNNGEVTDAKEKQNFKEMFEAAAAAGNQATVEKTIVSGGQEEVFKFDVTRVDDSHIIVCRHH